MNKKSNLVLYVEIFNPELLHWDAVQLRLASKKRRSVAIKTPENFLTGGAKFQDEKFFG